MFWLIAVNTLGLVFQRLGLWLVGFSMIILRLHYLKLIVTAIYTLSGKKNEGTLESLIEYSIIYTHFSYFFLCLFFLQGLINLKNYDDRLYVNVDDLAVWASDFSYRKGWSNGYWSPMTPSFISLYLLHLAIFFAD